MSCVLFRHHPPRRQNRTGVTFLASLSRRSRDESDASFPPLELEGLRPALASYLRIALHTSAAAAARRAADLFAALPSFRVDVSSTEIRNAARDSGRD